MQQGVQPGRLARAARFMLCASAATAGLTLAQTPAFAQPQVPNQTANSSMINLILQLVKQGSITPANGTILIQEALNGGQPALPAAATQYAPAPAYAQQQQQPVMATAQPAPARRSGRPLLAPVASVARAPIAPPEPVYAYEPAPIQPPPPPANFTYPPVQVAPPAPPVYASTPAYADVPEPVASVPAPLPSRRVAAPNIAPAPRVAPQTAAPVMMASAQEAQVPPPQPAPPPPPPAEPVPAPAPVAPPAAPAPTIRVSYVPESVRKQIAEEVRKQVMEQVKTEGWAAPGDASPDWVRRITISGDMRFRSQSELFSKRNANDLLDYGAVNATPNGADITNVQNLSFFNATQNRINRLRYRARIGLTAKVGPQLEAGFRLAAGDDNSPISTNGILGGGLSKKQIWLDQAYLKVRPTDWTGVTLGRFANPFRSTDLLFDEDLNFDGAIAEVRADKYLPSNISVALRGGAFPLDFGTSNFPNTDTTKRKYPAKWLFSGQLEATFRPAEDLSVSAAVAYHDFSNVQGQLSAPCAFNGVTTPNQAGNGTNAADPIECSTDGTRAFFPRKGNTLFFIRNLVTPDVNGVALERQYLGLTYQYRILDLNFGITAALNDNGVNARFSANYLRNLGFKRSDECRYGTTIGPFTNVRVTSGIGNACAGQGVVESGNEGWLANLTIGHDRPRKWGEWQAHAGYRYLQSDAVLDSFTDSDFSLGGTNVKGYTVGGSFGLVDGLTLEGRWLSANEITGRPLSIDVFQLDLRAEF